MPLQKKDLSYWVFYDDGEFTRLILNGYKDKQSFLNGDGPIAIKKYDFTQEQFEKLFNTAAVMIPEQGYAYAKNDSFFNDAIEVDVEHGLI